jgi:hypothetical protein
MKLLAILAVLTAGMLSMGCAESLPQAGPAAPASLTSADAKAGLTLDTAPLTLDPAPPLWLDLDPPAKSKPEGVWVATPPPARTWGVPSKADLPDYL